jgi:hypothetical protein
MAYIRKVRDSAAKLKGQIKAIQLLDTDIENQIQTTKRLPIGFEAQLKAT